MVPNGVLAYKLTWIIRALMIMNGPKVSIIHITQVALYTNCTNLATAPGQSLMAPRLLLNHQYYLIPEYPLLLIYM